VIDRERAIATAYEAFRKVRKLPADQLCLAVIDEVLQAKGMPVMDGDERRLVDAYLRCTWHPWTDGEQPKPAALPGRATLFD
jgi:hypothetical protein